MAAQDWTYVAEKKRYRDDSSGRLVTERKLASHRDTFTDRAVDDMRDLVDSLDDGSLSLPDWQREMRGVVKRSHIDQYLLGRGGRNAMTQRDWGRLGRALRDQYQYLDGFAQDIADGKLSVAQIRARADLYVESSTNAYERGREAAHDGLRLPAYPADGKTQCKARCRCRWVIRETRREYRATWTLGVAEHCPDCLARSRRWAPFVQSKERLAPIIVLHGEKAS